MREIYQHLYFRSHYSDLLEICAVADPNEQYRNWFCRPRRRARRAVASPTTTTCWPRSNSTPSRSTRPTTCTAAPTVDALNAGLDVVVPKPTAATVKDAHAMIQAAKKIRALSGH